MDSTGRRVSRRWGSASSSRSRRSPRPTTVSRRMSRRRRRRSASSSSSSCRSSTLTNAKSRAPVVAVAPQPGDAVPGNSRFSIVRRIGSGTFGEVYEAHGASDEAIAVKLERSDAEPPQLLYEKRIMDELRHVPGIPRLIFFAATPGYNVLGMQLLETDVEKLRARTGRLPVPFVTKIGYQTLQRLEALHSRGLAHRDIKPNNLMLGTGADGGVSVYLIDFGLAKRVVYRGRHITLRDDKGLAGTPRYASIRAHMGYEQSRRDDVESLMYVLVYLARGSLPWQGLEAATTLRYTALKDKKRELSSSDLCADLPSVFVTTLQRAKRLKFDECPDYGVLLAEWSAANKAVGDVDLGTL